MSTVFKSGRREGGTHLGDVARHGSAKLFLAEQTARVAATRGQAVFVRRLDQKVDDLLQHRHVLANHLEHGLHGQVLLPQAGELLLVRRQNGLRGIRCGADACGVGM